MVDVIHGDAREELAKMAEEGVRFDSCVTDPPYHLESIQKRFSSPESQKQKFGKDGRFQRTTEDFHGQSWDGADENGVQIAQDPEFWALVLAVLKPGAFCVAFSGSRTGPRQAVAMEDAGFVMHPMIPWVSAQGFPKAHSVARSAEKAGDSDSAVKWKDWYGGTAALSPACEPIYVGQAPFKGPMYRNVITEGVGAMNIETCRGPGGRWPSTFLHDGSEEVKGMFPNDAHEFYPAFRFNGKATGAERRDFEHPTVKPAALVSWLCRLVTPENGAILDPFAGSGTTGAAAAEEGFEATLIERERSYVRMINKRLGKRNRASALLGETSRRSKLLG